mgnify:CR=1 FL=1
MSESNTFVRTHNPSPVGQLKTDRGFWKLFFLSLITLGIYPIVFWSGISNDINVIASRYDGKKTMHYCLLFFVVNPLTLGIGYFVWNHKLCNRIGDEMARRGLEQSISAKTFWGWNVLGILLLVGPFVYIAKVADAMNALASYYNREG